MRGRRVLVPFVLALVSTLAVFAVVRWLDHGDEADAVRTQHVYDAGYAGPVWITVSGTPDEPQTIVVRWGPWQRAVAHEGTAPRTYVFTKAELDRGEPKPVEVELPAGGKVTFGQGLLPPASAVSIRDGWVRTAGSPPTT
jgi:hypothetical protein